MTVSERTVLGCAIVALWFGLIGPVIEQRIQTATLEGPKPFSLQNLRDAVNADTGRSDPDLVRSMARLAELQMAEEERISALWSVLDDTIVDRAAGLAPSLPPPQYAVDPRFFEPLVPEIIRRTIERYGVGTAPLSPAKIRQLDGDREDQLRVILAAVHHRLIPSEDAAALLQGAYDLLDLQMDRMELEQAIRANHANLLNP